ncbi:Uncharacterized protein PECH_005492 [Penicillium ucsense]|uniref:Rhodopsin domain-containing protein n=1 Tax=Penicillium ucsense TaxID=2839758 RepID=A0A8J8WBT5_9EURO|nr:Uncharacterized protein PECM_005483 [Penicillium ucsense]KAF7736256.1 Uncharacterized protein PECH_005492 [Penicillium ucsense]
MKLPPPEIMAAWPTPNYIDPVTRGHGVLYVNIVFTSLALLVVALRLYTRLRITCSAGVDDILIVIGLGFAIAMIAVTSLATESWGWNRHVWDVPPTWLSTVQKLNIVFQIMFSWASSVTKVSLLWFCRRLLGAGKGNFAWYNWAFIGSMAIVALTCGLFTIVSIFQCSPVKAYWTVNPTYPHKCLDEGRLLFAASVINIFTDFLATAIPMPLIWSLKLPTRQRLAVISIFSLGVMVNVAGSFRTAYVWQSMVVGYDRTWLSWPILVAASVEINLGLICSSAPALRPLVAAFLPRLLNSTRYYSTTNERSRSQKPWTANARSQPTHASRNLPSQTADFDNDRFEIMRTVEMETYSESRLPHHENMGHTFDIGTDGRAGSPTSIELKNGATVFSSAASDKSSSSLTRDEAFYGRR